jgi:hypothetical protein
VLRRHPLRAAASRQGDRAAVIAAAGVIVDPGLRLVIEPMAPSASVVMVEKPVLAMARVSHALEMALHTRSKRLLCAQGLPM